MNIRSFPLWGATTAPLARLRLSRAKHRSLAGHARWSRRVASWVPPLDYDEARWLRCDDAPADVVERRRRGLQALSDTLRHRHAHTLAQTAQLAQGLSDLQMTGRYRVPFPFARIVRERLPVGALIRRASGAELEDLDGQRFIDLGGSYGVNLLGHDAYARLMRDGLDDGAPLGLTLGPMHPHVVDVVARLKAHSGLDECSFHMSGTEAVMQAVRVARYHTRRRYVVRFSGAYHGWWGDVQPGVGNPVTERDTLTLAEMSERTLQVLRTRRDIACVLVNPLQAMHPNRVPPTDGALLTGRRTVPADQGAYDAWITQLRRVCTDAGIALIFDEVFTGFRTGTHGVRERTGVQPDLLTWGKTLGGGLPVGVLCGGAAWMRRYDPARPASPCLARGTFNAHPVVVATMHRFLCALDDPALRAGIDALDARSRQWAARFDEAFAADGHPLRIAQHSSVWSLDYLQPSRHHWMMQYCLRAEGIALGWTGTGRMILTLAHDDDTMERTLQAFRRAAARMRDDGWWWHPDGASAGRLQRQLLRDLLRQRTGRWFGR